MRYVKFLCSGIIDIGNNDVNQLLEVFNTFVASIQIMVSSYTIEITNFFLDSAKEFVCLLVSSAVLRSTLSRAAFFKIQHFNHFDHFPPPALPLCASSPPRPTSACAAHFASGPRRAQPAFHLVLLVHLVHIDHLVPFVHLVHIVLLVQFVQLVSYFLAKLVSEMSVASGFQICDGFPVLVQLLD